MDERTKEIERYRASISQKSFPDGESLISYAGDARDKNRRVLHVIPSTYYDSGFQYLGSTKDIDGRQQYLRQCGAAFDTFSHLKNMFGLADELSFLALPEYTHIIVDLSRRTKDLAYIKKRWPRAKLIVRSHNPEIAHRLDHFRAALRLNAAFLEKKSTAWNIPIFFKRERGVAKYADAILHIETPNTVWIWRTLGFRGEVLTTPYFTSDYYIERMPRLRRRKNQIICLGSSHPGLLIAEMMINFHRMTAALDEGRREFEFLATGDPPAAMKKEDVSPRVRHLGFVDDVPALLSETFAVAVTSDLGRGFKTKILEAINCGSWVIVTPGLMKRMPKILKPYCAVIDPKRPGDSLARAIDDLSGRNWPKGDPNAALREEAYRSLDAAIFGELERRPAFAPMTTYKNLPTRSAP